jgi:predicted RNA-binding protein Jag
MERKRFSNQETNEKVTRLIKKAESELYDSITPISFTQLSASDRRLIHRHFDHNSDINTKTYKLSEEEYELRIYPVGNLRRHAEKMADQAMKTGEKVVLPPMSSYERFIVHESLKGNDAIKSASFGEGEERHIEIEPEIFGRGLKKIIKKIKLF